MERKTNLDLAKKIMGENLIGPKELATFASKMGIKSPNLFYQVIPEITYKISQLENCSQDYILILAINQTVAGEMLTINKIREIFGTDPIKKEPCMYNQDWYLSEDFAKTKTLDPKWYLLRKNVINNLDGLAPDFLYEKNIKISLPSAILCAYTFFCYYLHASKILWENNFVWCADVDHNQDQVYVGRYKDIKGINKNGFNVHRHLSITKTFSYINEL